MKIVETEAKTILVKSKLPDTDYVVNPYTGCEFACSYCYASFMGRFVGEAFSSWGEYVYVKKNAPELFRTELPKLQAREPRATIFLSSVTDAWQPAERTYRLARQIVQELVARRYEGVVSILSKSPILLDDLGLLKDLPNADVGVTITATDNDTARVLESRAPSASRRLDVLTKLNAAGIKTYAFLGPVLPHFRFAPDQLIQLLRSIKDAGTSELYVELMNMSTYVQNRVDQSLDEVKPIWLAEYRASGEPDNRAALIQLLREQTMAIGMTVRLGGILDHTKLLKKPSSGEASVGFPS